MRRKKLQHQFADGSKCTADPEEGGLTLVGRVDVNGFATGALQVYMDGAYGAVCSTFFSPEDADVACQQMGFVGGTYLPNAISGDDPVERRDQLHVCFYTFIGAASVPGDPRTCDRSVFTPAFVCMPLQEHAVPASSLHALVYLALQIKADSMTLHEMWLLAGLMAGP